MQRGRDPTRRNRNLGTALSGRGRNNRNVVPRRFADSVFDWERTPNSTVVEREVWGRAMPFMVEDTLDDFVHACSVDDVAHLLRNVPKQHINNHEETNGIVGIVMRQPSRKESQLRGAWGRLAYSANVNCVNGPIVIVVAQQFPLRQRLDKRLDPDWTRELKRLRHFADSAHTGKRFHELEFSPQAVRKVQLYHTILHEIGHWVDMLEKVELPSFDGSYELWERRWNRYFQRVDSERERFANRYADELRAELEASGLLPFPQLLDPESLEFEELRISDFILPSSG